MSQARAPSKRPKRLNAAPKTVAKYCTSSSTSSSTASSTDGSTDERWSPRQRYSSTPSDGTTSWWPTSDECSSGHSKVVKRSSSRTTRARPKRLCTRTRTVLKEKCLLSSDGSDSDDDVPDQCLRSEVPPGAGHPSQTLPGKHQEESKDEMNCDEDSKRLSSGVRQTALHASSKGPKHPWVPSSTAFRKGSSSSDGSGEDDDMLDQQSWSRVRLRMRRSSPALSSATQDLSASELKRNHDKDKGRGSSSAVWQMSVSSEGRKRVISETLKKRHSHSTSASSLEHCASNTGECDDLQGSESSSSLDVRKRASRIARERSCEPDESHSGNNENRADYSRNNVDKRPPSSPVIRTVSDIVKDGNALFALAIFKVPVVVLERMQDAQGRVEGRRRSFVSAEARLSALGIRGLDFVWDPCNPSSKIDALKTRERCRGKPPPSEVVMASKRHYLCGTESADRAPKKPTHEKDLIANTAVSVDDGERQAYKIYKYSIYDNDGQPCFFESKILQKRTIFLSGNIKAIYDDSDCSQGIECSSIGPITSWWLTGFDSGDNVLIGMSTDFADYYLMEPDLTYRIFMAGIKRQIALTKVVVEIVSNNLKCSYEALVDKLKSHEPSNGEKPFVENELLEHGRFVLEHVCSYDSARAKWEKRSLSAAPCMQRLVNLCRMKLKSAQADSELQSYTRPRPSHAACTPIVRDIFDMMFSPEMDGRLGQSSKETTSDKDAGSEKCSDDLEDGVCRSVWARGERITCGDYVLTEHFGSSRIGHIVRLFTKDLVQMAHLQWFCFPKETVLGEVGNPNEVFMVPDCGDIMAERILQKMTVVKRDFQRTWNCSSNNASPVTNYETHVYFYSKLYRSDQNRFEDAPSAETSSDFCYSCSVRKKRELEEIVEVHKTVQNPDTYAAVRWRGETYRPGDFILIDPIAFRSPQKDIPKQSEPRPCHIAVIKRIEEVKYKRPSASDVLLQVSRYYRPEETTLGSAHPQMNVVFASEKLSSIPLSSVVGKTVVEHGAPSSTPAIWELHSKFFCSQAYCMKTKAFTDIGHEAPRQKEESEREKPEVQRLRTLDVFAGCGGLSLGLEMAGVSETLWALEHCDSSARAFQLNFPRATVFVEDCNSFLKDILEGKKMNSKGQRLPQKGDVELLCGGPPCQGFSLLNQHREAQSARFKNSLVASFLSLCDVFRPRYFVLENVRNFAYVEQHLVLQLTLKCLLRMGYQCTFSILQAGSFGLPQDRKRFLIIAAAPGEVLPAFPKPWTCCRHNPYYVTACGKKYRLNAPAKTAPLRTITVRDAIGDLASPVPRNDVTEAPWPISQFQEIMHGGSHGLLKDHQSKKLGPLIEARLQHIPKHPRANWQLIPDIEVLLSNGTMTEKLAYHTFSNGVRALCSCAAGQLCNKKKYYQKNTLRPWSLAHRFERASTVGGGLPVWYQKAYSRLDWDGHIITLTTAGVGTMCGCIHPDQDRFLTPRERARVQGFPDEAAFIGSMADKNMQIGNAVPPPLAAAVGLEILKSISAWRENRTETT